MGEWISRATGAYRVSDVVHDRRPTYWIYVRCEISGVRFGILLVVIYPTPGDVGSHKTEGIVFIFQLVEGEFKIWSGD